MIHNNLRTVSVVVPVYNPLPYLKSIEKSFLNNQELIGEIILINNGDDKQFEKLEILLKENNFIVISLEARKKCGPGPARDIGIVKANFPYIAFFDCDDEWEKYHLKNSLSVFANNNNVIFTYTDFFTIDRNGAKLTDYRLPKMTEYNQLILTYYLATPSVVILAEIAKKYKFGNRGHEDFYYFITILENEKLMALKAQGSKVHVLRGHKSTSSNKAKAIFWHVSRLKELHVLLAFIPVYFFIYAINAVLKRIVTNYSPVGLSLSFLVKMERLMRRIFHKNKVI
jgi:glycosyltransferase involved in cell wall biosynthesis